MDAHVVQRKDVGGHEFVRVCLEEERVHGGGPVTVVEVHVAHRVGVGVGTGDAFVEFVLSDLGVLVVEVQMVLQGSLQFFNFGRAAGGKNVHSGTDVPVFVFMFAGFQNHDHVVEGKAGVLFGLRCTDRVAKI